MDSAASTIKAEMEGINMLSEGFLRAECISLGGFSVSLFQARVQMKKQKALLGWIHYNYSLSPKGSMISCKQ